MRHQGQPGRDTGPFVDKYRRLPRLRTDLELQASDGAEDRGYALQKLESAEPLGRVSQQRMTVHWTSVATGNYHRTTCAPCKPAEVGQGSPRGVDKTYRHDEIHFPQADEHCYVAYLSLADLTTSTPYLLLALLNSKVTATKRISHIFKEYKEYQVRPQVMLSRTY